MTSTTVRAPDEKMTIADAVSSTAYPAKAKGGRMLLIGLIGVAVVVVGAVAWAAASWNRTAREAAGVDKYTVTPHSFLVELKEKGELKAANSVDIKCEVEGRSTIISLVDEGTAVKDGDLLVELASDQLEDSIQQQELKEAAAVTAYEAAKVDLDIQRDRNASDIRKGEVDVELKRLELEKYRGTPEVKGEWGQKLRDAEIAIQQAEIMLERREEDFEAAQKLLEKGFITKTKFREDEIHFKSARWDLEKAKLAKRVLEEYTHRAELTKRESDLEEAIKELERVKKNAASEEHRKARNLEGKEKELEITRAQLAKLREQKEKCRITAPAPGFVVYYSEHWRWGSDDQIKEGATVHERQVLMQLPDTSQMQVIVRIHEAKTDRIKVGQSVVVEVEGIPDRQLTGKVTKIAVVADTQNRWLNPELKEYETEIALDPTDAPLKPGMTAHARILVEEVEDVLAVPVQSIFTKAGRRYVFRANGPAAEPVEIGLGSIGTEFAEVVEGLSQGDQVVLAFSDEHTRLIPDVSPLKRPNGPPAGRRMSPRKAGAPGQGKARPAPGSPKGKKAGGRRTPTRKAPSSSKQTP